MVQRINIYDLGLVDYDPVRELESRAAARLADGLPGTLFLLEHPPTITFGRNGGEEYLPFPMDFFRNRKITLVKTTRGGSVTCHFPGQLVVYPVMRIDRRPGGLRKFFEDLEESAIRTVGHFGIMAERMTGRPGVWVAGRKICSIGLSVKHWITGHGLSLNVTDDLALFDLVRPCGLPGVTATSISRESGGHPVDVDTVKAVFRQEFCRVFNVEPCPSRAAVSVLQSEQVPFAASSHP